jgi:hypothetical protein
MEQQSAWCRATTTMMLKTGDGLWIVEWVHTGVIDFVYVVVFVVDVVDVVHVEQLFAVVLLLLLVVMTCLTQALRSWTRQQHYLICHCLVFVAVKFLLLLYVVVDDVVVVVNSVVGVPDD